jgi:glutamate/tyrosine decarboxylase-like PLP-dependent enzyme
MGGSRTADEMTHAWIAITHLDYEGYQELLAERLKEQSGGQSETVASAGSD